MPVPATKQQTVPGIDMHWLSSEHAYVNPPSSHDDAHMPRFTLPLDGTQHTCPIWQVVPAQTGPHPVPVQLPLLLPLPLLLLLPLPLLLLPPLLLLLLLPVSLPPPSFAPGSLDDELQAANKPTAALKDMATRRATLFIKSLQSSAPYRVPPALARLPTRRASVTA